MTAGEFRSPTSQATLLGGARIALRLDRDQLLLLFTSANLFGLIFDVAIAHSVNAFVPVYEWIPVFASPFGAASALWLAVHRRPGPAAEGLHLLSMLLAVSVGLLGFSFHLHAMLVPAGNISWAWIVFSAPVLAPLSFAGVGLVGIVAMLREQPEDSGEFSIFGVVRLSAPINKTQHLLWLVGLGLAGAAATSFLDHGQYGYTAVEWIPIIGGTFATIVTIGRSFRRTSVSPDDPLLVWTMLGMLAMGIAGFAFHLSRDLADNGALSLERMRSFAPIFAPLLYCDLGLLGLISLISPTRNGASPQL